MANLQVQVAGFLLKHEFEQFMDLVLGVLVV